VVKGEGENKREPNDPGFRLIVRTILLQIFVIVVTMIKQGYEDLLRHRADNVINRKHVTKVEDSAVKQIQSKNVSSSSLFFTWTSQAA
jgi:hypothetical protein